MTKIQSDIPSSLTNIAIIFEGLCNLLTHSIVERDESLGRKIKQAIIRGIQKNPCLKEELEFYRTVTQNNFKDSSLATAFIAEMLKTNAKQATNEQIRENISSLLQDLESSKLLSRITINEQNHTIQAYRTIEQLMQIRRKNNRTVQESKDYYKLLDQVVSTGAVLLERQNQAKKIMEPKVNLKQGQKLNSLVLKEAVKVFHEEFSEALSPAIKELIQDYLYYKKNDRFLHSLAKRLRASISETKEYISGLTKINDATHQGFETIVENMEACFLDIKQFSQGNNADEQQLFGLVREVATHLDIVQELKNITA